MQKNGRSELTTEYEQLTVRAKILSSAAFRISLTSSTAKPTYSSTIKNQHYM